MLYNDVVCAEYLLKQLNKNNVMNGRRGQVGDCVISESENLSSSKRGEINTGKDNSERILKGMINNNIHSII